MENQCPIVSTDAYLDISCVLVQCQFDNEKHNIFQLQGLLCDILADGPYSISKLFELLPLYDM
jgi:hypothetical protein